MISAGVKDVKNNLSRFLVQVKSGEEVLITERGMPVARIVKEDSGKRLMRATLGRLAERGLIALPSRSLLKDPAPVGEAPGKPVSEMVCEDRR